MNYLDFNYSLIFTNILVASIKKITKFAINDVEVPYAKILMFSGVVRNNSTDAKIIRKVFPNTILLDISDHDKLEYKQFIDEDFAIMTKKRKLLISIYNEHLNLFDGFDNRKLVDGLYYKIQIEECEVEDVRSIINKLPFNDHKQMLYKNANF
jgi:hypothetical protein